MFDPIQSHVTDAQARLLFEYQNAPLLNAFLQAIVQPIQDIESVLSDLNNLRGLGTASGQQLDNIGKIVGIGRVTGQSDASYLLSIYGQIGVNRSTGLAEDVIAAFLVYTGATDCQVWEFFPAAFSIVSSFSFPDSASLTAGTAFINSVKAAGVRFIGFLNTPPVIEFAFDGPQVGYLSAGFGDINDSSVGGFWASELDPTIPT